ncbi:MAG: hypothetical protein H6622_10110, partial [Halobacteriovoraceae bacterium]|nr:hypothetical protein [Halobacteriovoraceae bacterium]
MSKKGVAIPIVLSSITILTFLLVNFTFFAELNFIKADNIIHKTQARLNARSGLHFAMSMLTLYQQARNLLEENESIKSFVKAEDIEKILYNPFQFPIDDSVVTNEIMKTALGDFNEILMVNGKITLNISPITGHLNPNHMRFSHYKKKEDNKKNKDEEKDLPANEEDETEGDKTKDSILFVENEILTILKKNLEKEKEKNEDFDTLYGNLDPEFLVKELKFYVMDPGQFTDPEQGELEGNYDPSEANAKHKPLL